MSVQVKIDTKGLDKITLRLKRAEKVTFDEITPLLEEIAEIFVEDNRKGVLSAKNRDDQPMTPVKYRPKDEGRRIRRFASVPARTGSGFGAKSGFLKGFDYAGIGRGDARAHGNLTTKDYQKMNGPPLAPRYQKSRIITNYTTNFKQEGQGRFVVIGYWNEYIDNKGRPILPRTSVAGRNVFGLRSWGRGQCRQAGRDWLKTMV